MGRGGMPKKTKLGKTRLDKFYHLAKEQGWRSRASFKLIQLNKKYDLLSKSKAVLDLCAAPGSWSQVASKYCPTQSIIIAVDLVPIKEVKNVICLQEDITTEKCKSSIKNHLKTWKVDLVLNDGAPNVGGAWSKDAYTQSELSLYSLKLATSFLRAGGNFVTKVFRSQDYNALLWVFQQFFKRVESTKPQASRNESAEIFVVCLGYLAPKKIDPKLLDPKHVFEALDLNPAKRANVMAKKNTKSGKAERHRDGYEVGVTVLFKEISATDFMRHDDALQALTDYNKITMHGNEEGEAEGEDVIMQHPKTTPEMLECIKDLRVLGKADFRLILRWRDAIREALGIEDEKAPGVEERPKDDEELELDEEERTARDLERMDKSAKGRDKRKKRKEREKKAKYQRRIDLKMVDPNDILETPEELGLFSMKKVKTKGDLEMLEDGTRQADEYDSDAYDSDMVVEEESSEESEDELRERDYRREFMEKEFDEMYESYLERTGQAKKKERRGKKEKKAADPDELMLMRGPGSIIEGSYVPNMTSDPLIDSDDDDDDDDVEDHPLLDALEERSKPDAEGDAEADRKNAMLWFDQPIFKELNWKADGGAAGAEGGGKRVPKAEGPAPGPNKKRKAEELDDKENGRGGGRGKKEEDEGFEEVAADSSDTDSDDSDEDEYDEAELAALGSLLKKKKLRKEELIDACFHRYSFNDTHQAPIWFQDAEKKYNKRMMPVTKAQVEEMKMRAMEIAARPIKKVAEAKARKKIKAVRAHQKLAQKQDAVLQDSDVGDKAKMKALQKLYDKGVSVKRPKSVTVVAGRGTGGGYSKGGKTKTKIVDKRMKKDMKTTERSGNRNFKRGEAGKQAMKIRKKNKPKPVKK